MYSAPNISALFVGMPFNFGSADSSMFTVIMMASALAAVAIAAVAASTIASYFLHEFDQPQRRALKRLQAIREESSASLSAAVEAKNFDLDKALQRASEVPVVRIIALPIAEKLKQRRQQALRDSCMHDLPEMVDILSLALGAGLSIDQAFEWYLSSYDTPLAAEFRRAEQAYQVGMLSRMKAFEELAEALQEEAVLRFVNALRQAFTLGSSLGPALEVLSQEVRNYRKVRIEERIAKTPVKILAPLGLCIVPAVLILLMGPIMSQVLQGFQL